MYPPHHWRVERERRERDMRLVDQQIQNILSDPAVGDMRHARFIGAAGLGLRLGLCRPAPAGRGTRAKVRPAAGQGRGLGPGPLQRAVEDITLSLKVVRSKCVVFIHQM